MPKLTSKASFLELGGSKGGALGEQLVLTPTKLGNLPIVPHKRRRGYRSGSLRVKLVLEEAIPRVFKHHSPAEMNDSSAHRALVVQF